LINQPFVYIVPKAFWRYNVVSKRDRQYMTVLNQLEPYQPDKLQEPILLSKIPDAKTDEHRVAPIERSDWPAPPAPAAAYPELLRERCLDESRLDDSGLSMDDVIDDKENHRTTPGTGSCTTGTGSRTTPGTGSRTTPGTGRSTPGTAIDRHISELTKLTDSGAAQVNFVSTENSS